MLARRGAALHPSHAGERSPAPMREAAGMVEPSPTYTTIRYERDDRVGIVTLARPDRRNAISPVMQGELEDAFLRADDDRRVHVVVLRGDGPSFCSGYDLQGSGYEAFGVDPEHGRGTSAAIDDD